MCPTHIKLTVKIADQDICVIELLFHIALYLPAVAEATADAGGPAELQGNIFCPEWPSEVASDATKEAGGISTQKPMCEYAYSITRRYYAPA